jgi:hypothetical protein
MAVPWSPPDRLTVGGILQKHPPESGRCADAAREVLPIASAVDPQARARILRPTEGRFVATKKAVGRKWRHHVSVNVTAHFVDAITGPDGTGQDRYLDAHFQFPDAVEWEDADLGDVSL